MVFGMGSNSIEIEIESSGVGELGTKLKAAEKSLDGFGNKARTAGKVLAGIGAAGVVGVGAALGASVKKAAEFQDAMVQVEKVTDPATMRKMSEEIKNMATTIPLAQTELAQITEDAARFGIRGSENLTTFTETVAKMVNATDLGANQAGEAFAKLAQLTGMPISKVGNLGSAINSLSNTAATSSSEIVDAMMRASGTLASVGMNERQIAALSATMNEVSESSERAGTRLRRLGQEVFSATGQDAVQFGRILSGDMNLPMEKARQKFQSMKKNAPTQMLKTLAQRMKEGGKEASVLNEGLSTTSRQALSGLGQNLKGMDENLKTANESFREGTSLQKEFKAQSNTLKNRLKLLKNILNNVAITIGTILIPPLTKVAKKAAALIKGFTKWNKKMNGMPVKIGLVGAALGSLALLFTGVAVAAYGSLPALTAAAGGFTALAGSIAATSAPILPLIALIAALALAWKTNFMDIRGHTSRFVGFLKNSIPPLIRSIKTIWRTNIVPMLNDAKRVFGEIQRIIGTALRFVMNTLVRPTLKRLNRLWKLHGKRLFNEAKRTWDALLKNVIRPTINTIKGIIKTFVRVGKRVWSIFGDEILTTARIAFDAVSQIITTFVDAAVTGIRVLLAFLRGDWKAGFRIAKNFVVRTFNRVKRFIETWKDEVVSVIEGVIDGIVKVFEGLYNVLIGNKNSVVSNILGDIVGAITSWKIGKPFHHAMNRAVSTVEGFANGFLEAGEGLMNSVKEGIKNKVSAVTGAVEDAMDEVRSYLPGSDAKQGPLSDLTAAGKALPTTFAYGIEHNMGEVGNVSKIVAASAHPTGGNASRSNGGGGSSVVVNIENINASGKEEGREAGKAMRHELESSLTSP